MGNSYPAGNNGYRDRRTLSASTASVLADAHERTGASYRRVSAALGVSHPYWWRLCRGERAPTVGVALRIIDLFHLDDETADRLLAESVTKPDSR